MDTVAHEVHPSDLNGVTMKLLDIRSALVLLGCINIVVLAGCSTPPELKEASQAQLELVASLEKAVGELQSGVDAFHREQERLIVEAAFVELAVQAIDLAVEDNGADKQVTVDEVFDTYKREVELSLAASFATPGQLGRWDLASVRNDARATVKRINAVKKVDDTPLAKADQDKIKAAGKEWFDKLIAYHTNPTANTLADVKEAEEHLSNALDPAGLVRAAELTDQVRDIRRRRPTRLDEEYVDLFQSIAEDVASVQETRASAKRQFKLFRDQVAVMRVAATTIDAWLQQDVTISDDQAAALKTTFSDAYSALGGGGQ
tara:strand:+ start:2663 stop:3616 length:954 start_codon:yes stop_codon:yes gene_type:complete